MFKVRIKNCNEMEDLDGRLYGNANRCARVQCSTILDAEIPDLLSLVPATNEVRPGFLNVDQSVIPVRLIDLIPASFCS